MIFKLFSIQYRYAREMFSFDSERDVVESQNVHHESALTLY